MLAATLTGSALAHADGTLDPAFNGGAVRVGTNAQGLAWATGSVRIPAVAQADGRIVVGGASGGAMILARFNANGTLDTTYGTNGFVSARFAGTPTTSPGASGATALALDAAGNVLATGFGGSQSMFVARFSPAGVMTSSVVCFAPHLIDYTAHAIAPRPDGSVVIAGQARDRWHGTPYKFYGVRAVVQVTGASARTNGCGTWGTSASTRATIGSSGVTIDGLTLDGVVLDGSLAGRQYQGVAVRPDGSYVTAALNGAISSFTAASAVDTGFGTGGTTTIGTSVLHAVRLLPDGSVVAGGEGTGTANQKRLLVAKLGPTGAPAAFGTAGRRAPARRHGQQPGPGAGAAVGRPHPDRRRRRAQRQRLVVRGRAPHGGRPARHGVDAHGVATTTLGATGYATAISPSANGFVVAGRRADSSMGNAYMDVVVARYVGGP